MQRQEVYSYIASIVHSSTVKGYCFDVKYSIGDWSVQATWEPRLLLPGRAESFFH